MDHDRVSTRHRLTGKFDRILSPLDERRRRLYLASGAAAIGHGGITLVAAASGTSSATIARGVTELAGDPVPIQRVRAVAAGRKPLTAPPRPAASAGGIDQAAYPGVIPSPRSADHLVAAGPGLVSDITGSSGQCRNSRAPGTASAKACRAPSRPPRAPAIPTATPSSPT